MDADSRSTCVYIIRYKRTKKLESRGQYLKSLEQLILPMNFLETDNVVVLGKSNEVVAFSFPGENRDPTSPLVLQETHRRPSSGIWLHVFLFNRARCISGG